MFNSNTKTTDLSFDMWSYCHRKDLANLYDMITGTHCDVSYETFIRFAYRFSDKHYRYTQYLSSSEDEFYDYYYQSQSYYTNDNDDDNYENQLEEIDIQQETETTSSAKKKRRKKIQTQSQEKETIEI